MGDVVSVPRQSSQTITKLACAEWTFSAFESVAQGEHARQ